MNDQLMTLSKIFTERIFRIPDYQRGYAWTKKEVSDFWNDLLRLNGNNNHYVGVLTLEPVKESVYATWVDDLWLIQSKRYAPYYVVDGQQRLTTSILLIKSILNIMHLRNISQLNYSSTDDIRRRFIAESKDEHRSCSYLFGYEIGNPSYEYLISQIYNDLPSDDKHSQKTTYTLNLLNALSFFKEKLSEMSNEELENVYRKITQHFLFNTYEISEDIDVFVTFETMNNRGKPLSNLELLKNRLIYLSTLFDVPSDIRDRLRRDINDCWKEIYNVLGQGKVNQLPDDEFLDAHFRLYFCDRVNEIYKSHRKRYGGYYGRMAPLYDYLLEEYFVASKIADNRISTNDVIDYINSMKECIELWAIISNPDKSNYSEEIAEYIRKINSLLHYSGAQSNVFGTITADSYKVLLLACLRKSGSDADLIKFLKVFERYLFIRMFIPPECYRRNYEMIDLDVNDTLYKLNKNDTTIMDLREKIIQILNALIADEKTSTDIIEYYGKYGFYGEDFLRYFLCEYELHLQNMSKTSIAKLDRDIYFSKGYDSIEHVFPKRARHNYWSIRFGKYTQRQRTSLLNSLGNLVAVSMVKNGRLANLPFPEKRDGKANHIGYRYGTYAEIELAEYADWGPKEILERGLKLAVFLQDRWGIKIGTTKQDKIKFLGLAFLCD